MTSVFFCYCQGHVHVVSPVRYPSVLCDSSGLPKAQAIFWKLKPRTGTTSLPLILLLIRLHRASTYPHVRVCASGHSSVGDTHPVYNCGPSGGWEVSPHFPMEGSQWNSCQSLQERATGVPWGPSDQGWPRLSQRESHLQLVSRTSRRTESGVPSLVVGLIPAPEAAKAWWVWVMRGHSRMSGKNISTHSGRSRLWERRPKVNNKTLGCCWTRGRTTRKFNRKQ